MIEVPVVQNIDKSLFACEDMNQIIEHTDFCIV